MTRTTILVLALAAAFQAPRQDFRSPYTLDQLAGKQAVVTTSAGAFVIDLLPGAAPNHVAFFVKQARDGVFNGTLFHRVVRYGIIQGGDPLTTDPANKARFGSGGLNQLRREPNGEKHTAGAVSSVLIPGQPDSAGTQFFVCATDQPTLDGQYDVFGRVTQGLDVVQAISAANADSGGAPVEPVVIRSVVIRDAVAPPPPPFVGETAEDMAKYLAVLETTQGTMVLQFLPDRAPETVRNFLRLAQAGAYDGVAIHRVVPGFVIQTGAMAYRQTPLTPAQAALVHPLKPEFSDTPNEVGTVSMARGEDPGSATTSFFICIGQCRSLDGQYAAFATVISGLEVLNAIAAVPLNGEAPVTPVIVRMVKVNKVS